MSIGRTTAAELKAFLETVPDGLEVVISIPVKIGKDFVDVEKRVVQVKPALSRLMLLVESEIIDLNPK